MNFRSTDNLPKDIQSQLNIEYDEIERKKIKRKDIEIYIKQLLQAKNIANIQKLISCIVIKMNEKVNSGLKQKPIKKEIFEQSVIIPFLIELARKQITPRLTIEITCILLTNFVPQKENIQHGIIELYAELVLSKVKDIQHNAIEGLQKLARINIYRNKILFSDVLEIILNTQISDHKQKFDCLSVICACYPYRKYYELMRCIEYFCQSVLNDSDINITTWSLEALHQLQLKVVSNEDFAKIILEHNLLNRILLLICHNVLPLRKAALKTLVKIVNGDLFGIEEVILEGFIKKVPQLIQYNDSNSGTEHIFQILSVIAKGSQKLMQAVIHIDQIFDQFLINAGHRGYYIKMIFYNMSDVLTNSVSNCDMYDLQFLMDKGLFRIYKAILESNVCLVTLQIIQRGILQVLEKGKQLNENYYLIELKQLELDKLLYQCQQPFYYEQAMGIYNEIVIFYEHS